MKKLTPLLLTGILFWTTILTNCEKKEANPVPQTGQPSHASIKRKVLYESAGSSKPVSESVYEYDSRQQLMKVSDYYYDQTAKKLSSYFVFEYNPAGQLLEKTQYSRYFSDTFSEGEKSTYEYQKDQLVKETMHFQGKVAAGYTYEYQNKQLVKQTAFNERGEVVAYTNFEYDPSDNRVKEAQFSSEEKLMRYTKFGYRNHRLTEQSTYTADHTLMEALEYGYDQRNRVVTERFTFMNPLLCVMRPMLTRYEY